MNIGIEWLAAYLALGAFVGFFAGLLGVGGGAIMVPMLTTLFAAQGFPREHLVHLALGTSMAGIVITSISSLRAHHAHGAVVGEFFRLQLRPAGVMVEVARGQRQIDIARFADGLAVVQGFEHGEQARMPLQQTGQRVHDFCAAMADRKSVV